MLFHKIDSDWSKIGQVLVREYGEDYVYPCLYDAVAKHGVHARYNARVANQVGHPAHWVDDPFGRGGFWTLGDTLLYYDECGLLIPFWKLEEVAATIPPRASRYRRRYGPHYDPERDFRNGPVRGVRKWRRYRGYRHPATSQERRENIFLDHYDEDARDYGIKSRRGHDHHVLPTLWDDIHRGCYWNKGWKSNRKTQWREAKVSYRSLRTQP